MSFVYVSEWEGVSESRKIAVFRLENVGGYFYEKTFYFLITDSMHGGNHAARKRLGGE